MVERLRLVPSLALADLGREWAMGLCYVVALGAILVPVLVIDGLRVGVVDGLTRTLEEDPTKLRIMLPGTFALDEAEIHELRALDGVGYLEPVHRAIATRALMRGPDGRVETVDVLPSTAGDPLLEAPETDIADDRIVVSADLASRLDLDREDALSLHARRGGDEPATLDFAFTVEAVVPSDLLPGRRVLTAPGVADGLEAFRDGYALPEHGIAGRPLAERRLLFENVRLYASDLSMVEALARTLRETYGYRVVAAEDEVRRTRELGRDLAVVFVLIAAVGLAGFVLALAASLWANVERKRRILGVLRLLGATRAELVTFPLTHAFAIASLGLALAIVVAAVVGRAVNLRFADPERTYAVFVMAPDHVAAIGLLTLAAAGLAALLSGIKASRLSPTDGMRED